MLSTKLLTDSGSDISQSAVEEYGIDVFKFPVIIGGKEYESGVDFTNQEFYEILMKEPKIPTHAQITMIQFSEKFEEVWQAGYENLIYVSINKNGSATYSNAVQAREEFYENHPEARDSFGIYVVDSKTYSIAYGYAVTEAAKKLRRGAGVTEVVAYLEDWFDSNEIYFAPYTLEFVKKSGRVSCAAAFVGELLGLRPIISFIDGEVSIQSKVRGDKAIIPALLKYAKERMIPKTPYIIIRGSLEEEAQKLAKEAEKLFGYPPEEICEAGPVIAINAGPKLAAIVIKGQKKH